MDRYEAYKDSGVEWIGEIPEGWDVAKFNNACSSSLGKMLTNTPSTEASYLGRYLKAANVQEYGFTLEAVSEMYFEPGDEERYGIAAGDLLVVEGGSVGLAQIWMGALAPCYVQNALHRVRAFESFCTEYLKYSLDLARYVGYIDLVCNKATIAHFTKEKLLTTPLLVPSLVEQQAIADYLDVKTAEIDALVADCEREVELLREYRKAVISEAVTKGLDPDAPTRDSGVEWIGEIPEGWGVARTKQVCSKITDGSHFSPSTVDEGYPYITATNIRGRGIDYDSAKLIDEDAYNQLVQNGCRPQLGDVLMVKDGATTGRAGIMIDDEPCVILSSVAMMRPLSICNSDYLFYCIQSNSFQKQVLVSMAGSAMPRTTLDKLVEYYIVLPPVPKQVAISSYLDAKTAEIDSLIEAKQAMADKLREYRKSLISEAVTGKFKVPGGGIDG